MFLMKSRTVTDGHESNERHLRHTEEVYTHLSARNNWEVIECAINGVMRTIDDIHTDILKIVVGV
jgi:dTMP kinase